MGSARCLGAPALWPAVAFSLATPAHAGLVSYWSFDGCTLIDASGHNATLTSNGGPTCVAGRFGNAWEFNGSNWLDRSDEIFEPGSRAWSVALWDEVRIFGEELTPLAIANLFVGNSTTAVDDDRPRGAGMIDRSWPNPARGGRFAVSITLPSDGPAELALVDVAGRVVSRPMPELRGAGPHQAEFGADLAIPPGAYRVRLRQGARAATQQVIVLR